jgi:hypothetical protein
MEENIPAAIHRISASSLRKETNILNMNASHFTSSGLTLCCCSGLHDSKEFCEDLGGRRAKDLQEQNDLQYCESHDKYTCRTTPIVENSLSKVNYSNGAIVSNNSHRSRRSHSINCRESTVQKMV